MIVIFLVVTIVIALKRKKGSRLPDDILDDVELPYQPMGLKKDSESRVFSCDYQW